MTDPQNWTTNLTEFIREEDGERIGYLRLIDDLWQPLNLLGIPMDEASAREDAERILLERAMTSIIEPYWCKLPRPLADQVTDAREVDPDEWFHQVLVVEVNLQRATLRLKSPFESEQSATIIVALPADDVLFLKQPN